MKEICSFKQIKRKVNFGEAITNSIKVVDIIGLELDWLKLNNLWFLRGFLIDGGL